MNFVDPWGLIPGAPPGYSHTQAFGPTIGPTLDILDGAITTGLGISSGIAGGILLFTPGFQPAGALLLASSPFLLIDGLGSLNSGIDGWEWFGDHCTVNKP